MAFVHPKKKSIKDDIVVSESHNAFYVSVVFSIHLFFHCFTTGRTVEGVPSANFTLTLTSFEGGNLISEFSTETILISLILVVILFGLYW